MLNNIQALRGLAALWVMFFHLLPHFKAMHLSHPFFEFVASYGYFGVDVFFVISGFVMAKTTLNIEPSLAQGMTFMKKRCARIYLGFWPIFILAVIYLYHYDPYYLQGKSIIQSFFLINANMFDLVISPAWSLTYELYFYLLIGLMVSWSFIRVKILFVLLIVAIVIKNLLFDWGDHVYLDFFLSSLIIEFICGYGLFHLLKRQWDINLVLLIFLTIVSMVIMTYINNPYGYFRVLTFGLGAVFLVWLFIELEYKKIFVFYRIFTIIGDFSYTLYLIHAVLLSMFYTIGLRQYLVNNNIAAIGLVYFVVFIIFFSWVFYRLIEKPLYQQFKNKFIAI